MHNRKPIEVLGLILFYMALVCFTAIMFTGNYQLSERDIDTAVSKSYHRDAITSAAEQLGVLDKEYSNVFSFVNDLKPVLQKAKENQEDAAVVVDWEATAIPEGVDEWDFRIGNISDLLFPITKQAADAVWHNFQVLLFLIILLIAIGGALISFFPLTKGKPGIKNNHIMFRGTTARGWAGITLGIYLIAFYVVLYWFPEYIVQWTLLADDLSIAISGNPASQWFVYGVLYTLCILVMGVRMLIKYRHSKYQQIRTVSVMFFQTAFAFMIPQILVRLNQPYFDFKNIWPLDYDFFFDWNLNQLIASGWLGMFMLVWGILLIVIAVPVFSYFYGKRWYCSWVCGCGGLAETLGDPFRHLSDKSLPAWKIERWMIHGVLVFAVFMTALVLYTYFTGNSQILGFDSYQIRSWYGFFIGAAFAGVVGVGFYPFMGSRVWCRFGCPLAAYIGLIQRFKSRFRITVNGGQCISCGNCSTYCEMGIDVRWYAQRGQDVIRASCVGCGICSEVCPRGVLRLENASEDIDTRAVEQRVLHLSKAGVSMK